MTPEEFKAKLKSMGIDENTWTKTQEVDPRELPAVKKQVELLYALRGLLEKQIEKDIHAVDDLKLKIKKLKHGGGKI